MRTRLPRRYLVVILAATLAVLAGTVVPLFGMDLGGVPDHTVHQMINPAGAKFLPILRAETAQANATDQTAWQQSATWLLTTHP